MFDFVVGVWGVVIVVVGDVFVVVVVVVVVDVLGWSSISWGHIVIPHRYYLGGAV